MSGRRSRSLGDDERELWVTVTRSVVPLKRRKAATLADTPSAEDPKRKTVQGALPAPPAPQHAARKAPPLAPLGRRMKQKVARGSEPIDGRIDLHGMTQSEADHGTSCASRRKKSTMAAISGTIWRRSYTSRE